MLLREQVNEKMMYGKAEPWADRLHYINANGRKGGHSDHFSMLIALFEPSSLHAMFLDLRRCRLFAGAE